jgi:hypothetical protein
MFEAVFKLSISTDAPTREVATQNVHKLKKKTQETSILSSTNIEILRCNKYKEHKRENQP